MRKCIPVFEVHESETQNFGELFGGTASFLFTQHFYFQRDPNIFTDIDLSRGYVFFQLGRKICPEGREKVMLTTVHIRVKRVIKIAARSIGDVATLPFVPRNMSVPSLNTMPLGV
jgi:hypothetical protein